MELFQNELPRYSRKQFFPASNARVKPFDGEITSVEGTRVKKNRARKYHGPDSPLYSAIYPLVCIMKVFGLAPYDFTADEMTPSNVCLVFSFASMGIYSYIMYNVYLRFSTLERKKSIFRVVEATKVIVNYLVCMYELVSTIFRRKAFCRVWNALQNFDERLSRIGYPRKEISTKIGVWTLLISQTIVWTIVNQSGMYAFTETWLFNVSYMYIYIGTAASVYKFFGMTVQDLHEELMLCSEALGSLYSSSLLFWLVNLSTHSVSNMYFVIAWVMLTPWSDITLRLIFNMCSWLTAFVMQLLALHIACDYTITQANCMGIILVEWDARVIKKFPYDDTVRTTLNFLNRRLNFSAGDFFDVNLSLLCSIVGVLTTYLVILLQFPS